MVAITDVLPKSRAEKAGILAGDVLISINGKEINDVLDYRFHLANREITLCVKRGADELCFVITKKENYGLFNTCKCTRTCYGGSRSNWFCKYFKTDRNDIFGCRFMCQKNLKNKTKKEKEEYIWKK